MSRCKSCSAPLPANTNVCRYCSVRNDIDLHEKRQYSVNNKQSGRICPQCHVNLQTIDLNLNGSFLIEHCKKCFGLFFDPGEIETMLENSVSNVFQINRELLRNINKERYQSHKKVRYIKCPVCQGWMKRKNFGYRSGVIINQCKQHGIWLESGQITHLMEWKKAGGQILHDKKSATVAHKKKAQKTQTDFGVSPSRYGNERYQPDLIESVASLVFKLFN